MVIDEQANQSTHNTFDFDPPFLGASIANQLRKKHVAKGVKCTASVGYETVELPQELNEETSVRHKQPWKLRGRKCHPESLAQGLVRPGFWQTVVSESINEEAKRSIHNTFDFDPLL